MCYSDCGNVHIAVVIEIVRFYGLEPKTSTMRYGGFKGTVAVADTVNLEADGPTSTGQRTRQQRVRRGQHAPRLERFDHQSTATCHSSLGFFHLGLPPGGMRLE